MTKPALVSVYDLTNSTKKELLIGIGDDGREPTEADLKGLRPAHWSESDQVTVHLIESRLKPGEALAFRDNYAKNLGQMPGWTVIRAGDLP